MFEFINNHSFDLFIFIFLLLIAWLHFKVVQSINKDDADSYMWLRKILRKVFIFLIKRMQAREKEEYLRIKERVMQSRYELKNRPSYIKRIKNAEKK